MHTWLLQRLGDGALVLRVESFLASDLTGCLQRAFKASLGRLHAGPFSVCGSCGPFPGSLALGSVTVPLPLDAAGWASVRRDSECSSLSDFASGVGEERKLDLSVRHTWQVEPADVALTLNDAWLAAIDDVVRRSAAELGCAMHDVVALPFKLLVYEAGSHFAAHVDREKEQSMFATLVVQLPSLYEGGGLLVRHKGDEVLHDFGSGPVSAAAPELGPGTTAHFATHLSDVEHVFLKVTSGFRVAMIYSLCWHAPGAIEGELGLVKHRANARAESSKAWGPSWAASVGVGVGRLVAAGSAENTGAGADEDTGADSNTGADAGSGPARTPATSAPAAPAPAPTLRLGPVVAVWRRALQRGQASTPLLAVGLDHAYTASAIALRGVAALKGWDAALVRELVAPDCGLDAYLVRLRVSFARGARTHRWESELWLPAPGSAELCLDEGEQAPFCQQWGRSNTVCVRGEDFWTLDSKDFKDSASTQTTYMRYAFVLWSRGERAAVRTSCLAISKAFDEAPPAPPSAAELAAAANPVDLTGCA